MGWTKSPMSVLTALSRVAQPPVAPGSTVRSLILPSFPTTTLIRSSSCVELSSNSTTSLKASAMPPPLPFDRSAAGR